MVQVKGLRGVVFTHALITWLLAAAIGCGSAPLKKDAGGPGTAGHDAGGDATQGTAGGGGGTGGAGAAGASGSPGSVTLRLVISPGESFCDQACGGLNHISIIDGAGHTLQAAVPTCATFCSSTCQPTPCPAIACFPTGRAVQTSELVWDGTSMTVSTCGKNITCFEPGFAPAGHYVARMCATPGTLTPADAGAVPSCTATGPLRCVDVPFDYPGQSPVTGTLP